MLHRAFRYRIYPTAQQEETFLEWIGTTRFVYNLAWEQRRDWWRQHKAVTGRSINWASQSIEVSQLRREFDWIAAVPRVCLEQALRDLDAAYLRFFKQGGHPTPRRKGDNDSIRFLGRDVRLTQLNAKWAVATIPKMGSVKLRLSRGTKGVIKSVTISRRAGAWYASFAAQIEHVSPPIGGTAVGVDRGVVNTISLSTGEHYQMPDHRRLVRRRKAAQRALARCVKGSKRREKAKLMAARASGRIAFARAQWLHERSTLIASRYGIVCMEALRIPQMTASGTGKRGLNRSILEQGWGSFATMLEYKLAERGGRVEYVNPAYTSQTCSDCGCVAKESRKSQAVFLCVECGHSDHADTNAALNILRRSPACVEGIAYDPDEARTLNHFENLAA